NNDHHQHYQKDHPDFARAPDYCDYDAKEKQRRDVAKRRYHYHCRIEARVALNRLEVAACRIIDRRCYARADYCREYDKHDHKGYEIYRPRPYHPWRPDRCGQSLVERAFVAV